MKALSRYLPSILLILTLAACAAAGVPYTSDPYEKLAWSNGLTHMQNRPLPAQGLIVEAIDIFKQRHDEAGLAKAYRSYANFLTSPAVTARREHYEKHGFADKSVNWQNRYAKAIDYLEKSRELFAQLGRADELTFTYVALGKAHALANDQGPACRDYAESKASYRAALAANPAFNPALPAGVASVDEYIGVQQAASGCG